MYALYEEVPNDEEDKEENEASPSSSSSCNSFPLSMESTGYYSPGSGSKTPCLDHPKGTTTDAQSLKSENSCYSLDGLSVASSYKEEDRGRTVEKLMKETDNLKDRLDEKEKKCPNLEKKSSLKMKVLEDRLNALKVEIETLNYQKNEHEYEQEFKGRHDDFHRRKRQISGLKSVEYAFKEKESEIFKKFDECEKIFNGKIEEYMDQVQNLRVKVDCLRAEDRNFTYEKEKELESLRIRNQESEMEIERKTKEAEDSHEVLEALTEKLKQMIVNEESLKTRVKDLEVKIVYERDECRLSKYENEDQRKTICELEEKLQEKDSRISTLESTIEGVKLDLTNKIKSLEQKFKSLEIEKVELEEKNDVLASTLEQRDLLVNKLNHEAKSSFRTTVKKMGEMVDEFRKKSEDSIRILSRRIRVAEQLHNETREWYKKTKEKNEEDKRDNELAFRSIKVITKMVSDTLSASETIGQRFAERCDDFTNRVSKVSCETNFVKDWAKRKNSDLVQVKEDYDALLVKLDDKEEEILVSRQKVLKLETKVRDLEKIMKEKDETLIGLQEEKREAIRQLCVWIDYHRSRSDYFKKAFSELVTRTQRPA
ncbi:uncharacterized protein [Rutidosis leptorrhynchoides]|uniref:uncharacterized protein n=1 Tax=Rutidosis leptorrhynchoides TaxID=125765 RepID=UPI003A9A279D